MSKPFYTITKVTHAMKEETVNHKEGMYHCWTCPLCIIYPILISSPNPTQDQTLSLLTNSFQSSKELFRQPALQ